MIGKKKFAVVEVSRKKEKTGSAFFKQLVKEGYDVYPINPNMETFDGQKCYASVIDSPDDVEVVVVVTKPEQTINVVKQCYQRGIKYIWVQQGAQNEEVIKYCEENKLNVVFKQYILMFAQPRSIHAFHAWIKKLFGTYPK